jgi:hypothetical protein
MLFLIDIPAIAQTEKGKFVLGGDTKLTFASARINRGTEYYETGYDTNWYDTKKNLFLYETAPR